MFVDVALVPHQAQRRNHPVCILVDVLRASSTIVTLFDRGVSIILPVGSVRQARRLAHEHGYLLAGERNGLALPGFDFGNSPAELIHADLSDRGVVLTTRNGTAALIRLTRTHARAVLIGCIMNATACCEQALALAQQGDTYLSIVCAGQKNRFVLDDGICAGFLVETIVRMVRSRDEDCLLSDAALAAQKLYHSYDDILSAFRESNSGKIIIKIGLEADLPLCARPDVSQVVPTLTQGTQLQIERLIDSQC